MIILCLVTSELNSFQIEFDIISDKLLLSNIIEELTDHSYHLDYEVIDKHLKNYGYRRFIFKGNKYILINSNCEDIKYPSVRSYYIFLMNKIRNIKIDKIIC